MRSKLFDSIKFFVGWPISIVSIFFLLKFFPSQAFILDKIKEINSPIILLSILFFELYFLLRGFLWQSILKQKGYLLPLKKVLFLWSFSELKRYTPGNIWSFIARYFSFKSAGVKGKDIVSGLFIEAQTIVISGFLISLLSLNFIFDLLPDFKYEIFAQPLIAVTVLTLTSIFLFTRRKTFAQNFNILFLGCASLICFGIGTYFAASSIFFLDPRNFSGIVGFFVLSLLIGYLSIITPMGLGVREGVITLVLSKIIPLQNATFISIFSRLVLIFSEAIFISLSWVLYQSKSKRFLNLIEYLSSHKYLFILTLFIIGYFIYFTVGSFYRYDAFYTGRFDLGNMDQTIWNTIHGRIFQLTNPNGTETISRLSFHADFILILISPLYLIWSSPKMLLLLQTLVVSLGAIFVYLIAKDLIKNNKASLLLAISFLLNPALEHSNLYDFHPVVLATTFLLAAFFFMIRKSYFWAIVFLILSGFCKENVWVIASLFGIYIAFFQKKIKIGIPIFLTSFLIFIFLVWFAIPKVAGTQYFALSYYSDFGDSPTKVLIGVLRSPHKVLSTILEDGRLTYLQQLFQPLGFLPIFSLYIVFSFPSLIIDVLSNNSQLHKIYYQYSASITPFLFIAAIYSINFLRTRTPSIPVVFYGVFILLSTLFSAYQYGPMLGAKNPNVFMFTERLENERLIDRFLQGIPKRYSIASTNEVGSHLSHRQKIYTIPVGIDKADIIIMLDRVSLADPSIKIVKETSQKLLSNKNYFVVYRDDQFIVFKKRGLRKSFYRF